jgi:DNA-binding CsgD family transcriptional regulator
MADDVNLLRIIGQIYDAAADPSAFGGLSKEIAREFACDTSLLYVVQNPKAKSTDLLLSATDNFDDWAHSSYTGYYRQRDVWGAGVLKVAAGRPGHGVFHGQKLLDTNTLLRSEIYSDWYRKVGIFHTFLGLFPISNDLGIVTINRPAAAKAFDQRDEARLGVLVPHLQRAVQIHQRLSIAEQQRALTFEMLERLTLGIFVLGADARVIFANAIAQRNLQPGASLQLRRGCLRLRHPAQQGRFEKAVHDAALTSVGQGTSAGGFVAVRRPEGPPLSLLISPYRVSLAGRAHPRPSALLIFADPDTSTRAPEQILAQMFGLAPAEARLVSALVAGQTMADYADGIGISTNTVKTQMRQIFYKTGCNRQTDVIRAALANPLIKLASADYAATSGSNEAGR